MPSHCCCHHIIARSLESIHFHQTITDTMRCDSLTQRMQLPQLPQLLAPALLIAAVALFHSSVVVAVDAAPTIANQLRSNAHLNAITNGARFRTFADAG